MSKTFNEIMKANPSIFGYLTVTINNRELIDKFRKYLQDNPAIKSESQAIEEILSNFLSIASKG